MGWNKIKELGRKIWDNSNQGITKKVWNKSKQIGGALMKTEIAKGILEDARKIPGFSTLEGGAKVVGKLADDIINRPQGESFDDFTNRRISSTTGIDTGTLKKMEGLGLRAGKEGIELIQKSNAKNKPVRGVRR